MYQYIQYITVAVHVRDKQQSEGFLVQFFTYQIYIHRNLWRPQLCWLYGYQEIKKHYCKSFIFIDTIQKKGRFSKITLEVYKGASSLAKFAMKNLVPSCKRTIVPKLRGNHGHGKFPAFCNIRQFSQCFHRVKEKKVYLLFQVKLD